jgi:MerR family transcriptional regulator, thiopeptide resistance regulator
VIATIEAMSRVVRRSDARWKQGTAPGDAEARWRELGDELRACMKAGEAPSAPRPRAVARAALARIAELAGGDRATLEALAHLRRHHPPKDLAGGPRR